MNAIAGLLVALLISFATIAILLSMLNDSDSSYMRDFSNVHLRRGDAFVQHDPTTVSAPHFAGAAVSENSVVIAVEPTEAQQGKVPKGAPHQVAVMVIYVGSSLPTWFRTFALSTEMSGTIIKWIIFVTEAHGLADNFQNIEIIRLSRQELYERLTRLDPFSGAAQLMDNLITKAPYSLVEFKPCLATIFEEYLTGYSHWGYADIDVLMGRSKPFLTEHMLSYYDIYTVSFGDNRRYYMRGQLTVMKNNNVTNNLWRKCHDLSNIGRRLKSFFEHPDSSKRMNGWRFESAEGCISKVVAEEPGIRSIATSVLISDAFKADTVEKETLIIGATALRCYGSPLASLPIKDITALLSDHWEYPAPNETPNFSIRVKVDHRNNCAFWIPRNYQVCLQPAVAVNYDTVVENTAMFASKDYYSLPPGSDINGTCREAMMSHFQGWKKEFSAFSASQPPADAHATVITSEGFIYLRIDDESKTLPNLPASIKLQTYGELLGERIQSGRLTPDALRQDISFLGPSGSYFPNLLGSDLSRIIHDTMSAEKVPYDQRLELYTDYCVAFKDTLGPCSCRVAGPRISVLKIDQTEISRDDLTLVTVGWADEVANGAADRLLDSFKSARMQKIVVVAFMNGIPPAPGEFASLARSTVISVDLSDCANFLTLSDERRILPDKMMYNMGIDVAHSDVVLLAPLYGSIHPAEGVSGDSLLDLVTAELRDNEGYAVVIPIDKNSTKCDASLVDGLRRRVKPKKGEIFSMENQMVPIVFNMRHTVHGTRSARLPEELNGDGCYSSALFRVLSGYGYRMAHSRLVSVSYSHPDFISSSIQMSNSCGCIELSSRATDEALMKFQTKASLLFRRMKELRDRGINDVYARKPLGFFY